MIEPSSERYVKAGELAELMGVSVRTINRWVTEGMPSEDWGMSRTRRYVPSQSIEWAHARATRDKMERHNDHRSGRRANASGPDQ